MTPKPPRAPDGTGATAIVLRMDRSLRKAATRAAKLEKVTLSEWIREAMRRRLG